MSTTDFYAGLASPTTPSRQPRNTTVQALHPACTATGTNAQARHSTRTATENTTAASTFTAITSPTSRTTTIPFTGTVRHLSIRRAEEFASLDFTDGEHIYDSLTESGTHSSSSCSSSSSSENNNNVIINRKDNQTSDPELCSRTRKRVIKSRTRTAAGLAAEPLRTYPLKRVPRTDSLKAQVDGGVDDDHNEGRVTRVEKAMRMGPFDVDF